MSVPMLVPCPVKGVLGFHFLSIQLYSMWCLHKQNAQSTQPSYLLLPSNCKVFTFNNNSANYTSIEFISVYQCSCSKYQCICCILQTSLTHHRLYGTSTRPVPVANNSSFEHNRDIELKPTDCSLLKKKAVESHGCTYNLGSFHSPYISHVHHEHHSRVKKLVEFPT